MPIPGDIERRLGEIDDLHSGILVRLRVWQRAGPDRDPKSFREALQAYAVTVVRFVNGDDDE